MRPAAVVLTAIQHREIETVEALSDLRNVRAIAAVAAEENTSLGSLQCVRCPQRFVFSEQAPRVVACREHVNREARFNLEGAEPIGFADLPFRITPLLEVSADAQARDHRLRLRLQGRHTRVVEVVPVVVRDEQVVDFRHVFSGKHAGSFERSVYVRKRRS